MSVTIRIGRLPELLLASGAAAIMMITALATWASSAAHASELRVTGAYMLQPASPDVAAAYFTITDSGDDADQLIGVTSDAFGGTMMMQGGSMGPAMKMATRLPIPAHGRLVFRPGGYQVMLEMPVRRLRQGDHVNLTFRFRRSPAITVEAPVTPVGHGPDGT